MECSVEWVRKQLWERQKIESGLLKCGYGEDRTEQNGLTEWAMKRFLIQNK